MFGNFLNKRSTNNQETVSVHFEAAGIKYISPTSTTDDWLSEPYKHGDLADRGARLKLLYSDGLGQIQPDHFFLTWDELYSLQRRGELSIYAEALGIPAEASARPRLSSRGAIADSEFAVLIDGWVDPQGKPLQPAPKLLGRVLDQAGHRTLVPDSVHLLLDEVETFHRAHPDDRTLSFKEACFGRMRRWAVLANCPVSDYVSRTIVLTPERLKLKLEQRGEGKDKTIDVIPGFEDAPSYWLALFDRLPLQDRYDVPDGPALVRVVITPEVRSVLAEIKQMPGRRAHGPRAEAFVRNPFAALGESAHKVIDPEQFEQDRAKAGIEFHRFKPHAERGEKGQVVRVALLVDVLDGPTEAPTLWMDTPQDLNDVITTLESALVRGSQCFYWHRRELEIDGDTADHLASLKTWLREWHGAPLFTATEVFDLSNYSKRIEGVGEEKPYVVPVIALNDEGNDWFPENVSIGLSIEGAIVPYSFDEITSLKHAVEAAESANLPEVSLPGLKAPVPTVDARRAVDALVKAEEDVKRKTKGPPSDKVIEVKNRLVIKRNLEDIDYTEERAASLGLVAGAQPKIPLALKSDIKLKDHQRVGVAWLQHLWSMSPDSCRGTILADDMGLGKTLQLLTFIASAFEENPSLPPALVVAPVALLENWRNELNRFFEPGSLPLLMLYGQSLRQLRVDRLDLDDELKAQGVTRLLHKGWVGDAKLVLTTYETLRDMEFALASQPWSIMVCDEAQKIKTPSAMMTRSAKKQKVRFRVACTGTPVENSLADLWCLFDFVQPGMLGALNHFCRTYRQPIEAKTEDQLAKVEELRKLIEPQILHRKKGEVVKDLPATVEDESCKRLMMSAYQSHHYELALNTLALQRDTDPSAQLQALFAIRQICSDPHGYAEKDVRKIPVQRLVNESPKMGWMVDRLKSLAADKVAAHKVIVFCEFRELQLQLQRVIAAFFGIAPSIVNGDTSADPTALGNRQALIDGFQACDGFNVIILSPLAVGFGVNVQAANHVIHFTRTWNPAKEDQATARAHRIGQTRVVNVYYPGVVSETFPSFDVRLDGLLKRRRELAADILNGSGDLSFEEFGDFGAVNGRGA